jgi:hypothetical protein
MCGVVFKAFMCPCECVLAIGQQSVYINTRNTAHTQRPLPPGLVLVQQLSTCVMGQTAVYMVSLVSAVKSVIGEQGCTCDDSLCPSKQSFLFVSLWSR